MADYNFDVICRELRRAKNILKEIAPRSLMKPKSKAQPQLTLDGGLDSIIDQIEESKESQAHVSWTKLLKRLSFFGRYEHFIRIDILG